MNISEPINSHTASVTYAVTFWEIGFHGFTGLDLAHILAKNSGHGHKVLILALEPL